MTHTAPNHYQTHRKDRCTLAQRRMAARLISAMKDYYKASRIAEMVGIDPKYISAVEHMAEADTGAYRAPAYVIERVLSWGMQTAVMEVA